MKDKKDSNTFDIFTVSRPVGRPRKFIDNAAKMRDYRKRKKLEQLKNGDQN